MNPILIDCIGYAGMACNVLSMQCKTARKIIIIQMIGGMCFLVNMWLLGAMAGALMNLIAVLRALIYTFLPKRNRYITGGILAATLVCYVLVFAVFGKEPTLGNLLLELLPIIGMIASTVSFHINKADAVRKLGLISSPSWLTYNLINGAWGGALCEIFTLISIAVAFFRFRNKPEEEQEKKDSL